MFKKFVEQIAAAKTTEEMDRIFLDADVAYQREKLSLKDHQMIWALVENFHKIERAARVDGAIAAYEEMGQGTGEE